MKFLQKFLYSPKNTKKDIYNLVSANRQVKLQKNDRSDESEQPFALLGLVELKPLQVLGFQCAAAVGLGACDCIIQQRINLVIQSRDRIC